MQRLFAPWRFAYVSSAAPVEGCVFCRAAVGGEDELLLWQGARAFAMLNRYPYTSGHAMVAPLRHVAELGELDQAELTEMMTLTQRVIAALKTAYHPHGCNLGMNLGEAAGAGIVDHLHMHIVPRWRGDTNFMSVAGGVRVLPEDLPVTCGKLREALEAGRG